MLIFASYLLCAGVFLGFFVRFPALVLIALVAAIVSSTGVWAGFIGPEFVGSMLSAFVLSIVMLQVGYGFGIIADGCIRAVLKSLFGVETRPQRASPPDRREARPQIDSSQ